ncbi:fumarylacetoacetate hydrolase family protein [Bacillus sp. FJAT-50079]|uniref:fumarylacetoacetate hydrolase family protein n=1 Tax=Bacillus sp. FJAT-50079 TaxID=2833577 RepID=UPI001BC9BE24|nr:fumarylacetoacetate hydrolase family protein [Bacillus sp. FJAT-50079]MBS4210590.1 fumarylacetoacetate hydrolase family protein [Bacillus sp. FJAT-50079]
MKFLRFLYKDKPSYGIVQGDEVVRIEGSIYSSYEMTEDAFALSNIKVLAPVIPNKVVAIGLNYKRHAEEVNMPLPTQPRVFLPSVSAIIGTEDTIELVHPEHKNEHEGELAVIIGKRAYHVSEEAALEYVLGFTCCNDISDRNIQLEDGKPARAKSFPTYKPLGPVIETNLNPDHLQIQVRVNGQLKQDSNSNDMIFSVRHLISYISHQMVLEPGDVIITGTPSGVSPLTEGDLVEVEIEGIGVLRNQVVFKNNGDSPK